MDSLYFLVALGALAGLIAYLRVTAKATKTTADDKLLEYAEKAQDVVDGLRKPKP